MFYTAKCKSKTSNSYFNTSLNWLSVKICLFKLKKPSDKYKIFI